MSNSYEERQEARRQRFQVLAEKNTERSSAFVDASRRATEGIPLGQPILVGHHSEGRHRAALKRSHSAMDKSVEAMQKADYYAGKAAGVGRGGISSDDPEAIKKLRAELVDMQASQDSMKAANKAIRANKSAGTRLAALIALGFSERNAAEAIKPDYAGRIWFPGYALSNNSGNMRRIELRIKQLEAIQERQPKEEAGAGYTYREDTDENRVMFIFEGKPDVATRQLLKANGFKWSPSRDGKPWVRHLNNAGLWCAKVVREKLDAADDTQAEPQPSNEAEFTR